MLSNENNQNKLICNEYMQNNQNMLGNTNMKNNLILFGNCNDNMQGNLNSN